MTRVLSLSAAALSLLGAALLSAPASATDFSESADFGGTYGYIGPGVASLPDLDVDVGPAWRRRLCGAWHRLHVPRHGLCLAGLDLGAGLSASPA